MGTQEGWWSGQGGVHTFLLLTASPSLRPQMAQDLQNSRSLTKAPFEKKVYVCRTSPCLREAAGEKQVTHWGANNRNWHQSRARSSSLRNPHSHKQAPEHTGFSRPKLAFPRGWPNSGPRESSPNCFRGQVTSVVPSLLWGSREGRQSHADSSWRSWPPPCRGGLGPVRPTCLSRSPGPMAREA